MEEFKTNRGHERGVQWECNDLCLFYKEHPSETQILCYGLCGSKNSSHSYYRYVLIVPYFLHPITLVLFSSLILHACLFVCYLFTSFFLSFICFLNPVPKLRFSSASPKT